MCNDDTYDISPEEWARINDGAKKLPRFEDIFGRDEVAFQLSDEEWDDFVKAVEGPPQRLPRLAELLKEDTDEKA